jgi:hypothetical protein
MGKSYGRGRETCGPERRKPSGRAMTMVRVSFPESDEMRIGKAFELSAPGGVSLVLGLPFPISREGLAKIAEKIEAAGGTLEVIDN